MSSNSLNLTNVKTEIFNDIYLVENNNYTSIYDLFYNKNDGNSGIVAISDFNSFVDDTDNNLSLKANLESPSFTGNIGINLSNTDVLDSALLVKGQRNDNPTKEGIRMGYSFNVIPFQRSYGIEICSEYTGRSTIDFTYPDISSYYAGRISFDNEFGVMNFRTSLTNATSEVDGGYGDIAILNNGEVVVQSKISVPLISLNNVDLQTTLNTKANLANPTFTGTVNGITKSMVGLGNVDNTTDLNKPVSTATSTALGLKANLASPTFTGTVNGITAAMVGLGNVNNTSDLNKPISTATQTALNDKASLTLSNNFLNNSTFIPTGLSDAFVRIQNDTTSATSTLFLKTLGSESQFRADQTSCTLRVDGNRGFQIYNNSCMLVGNNSGLNNKILILRESGAATDDPLTTTNFFGFGVNSGVLRYQTSNVNAVHRFYSGTTLGFTISQTGGVGPSDIRFKSDIQPLTNALEKINNIQPKSFYLYGDTSKRQIGFIAQELLEVLPEVVVIDEYDENHYMGVQYDKITALLCQGIKELQSEIQSLKNRVQILENV